MRKTVARLLLLAVFSASAVSAPAEEFPFTHKGFDFVISWRMDRSAEGTVIEGSARNIRFAACNEVEVGGTLLDASGRVLADDRHILMMTTLRQGDDLPFRLSFKLAAGAEPALLKIRYSYWWVEGDHFRNFDMQSFDVDLKGNTGRSSRTGVQP